MSHDDPRRVDLVRRLGTRDATLFGLGSMLGAGVFVVFAPAAQVAGPWLLLGLALAGVIAYANATSSAQLAVQYPRSGGTYVYGRERLGPWWGYLAGWSFVVGKTASAAAMALTVAAYTVPPPWQRPVAIGAVLVLAAVDQRGITRTATVTRVLVLAVLAVLALVVGLGTLGVLGGAIAPRPHGAAVTAYGVLQAGGLLFFAFAGYARLATLGEEVADPARTIPRAVAAALGIAVVVYALVGSTALLVLGPDRLGASRAPLVDVVVAAGYGGVAPVVVLGATSAGLGALLALLTGIGRTVLAMARERDLPAGLAQVDERAGVPRRAGLAVAAVVCALLLVADLRGVVGFSSFGVLLYYLVANLAAWTQDAEHRRYPRALPVLGMIGCVVLAATLPWTSVLAGTLVVGLGLLLRIRRLDRPGVVVRRRWSVVSAGCAAAAVLVLVTSWSGLILLLGDVVVPAGVLAAGVALVGGVVGAVGWRRGRIWTGWPLLLAAVVLVVVSLAVAANDVLISRRDVVLSPTGPPGCRVVVVEESFLVIGTGTVYVVSGALGWRIGTYTSDDGYRPFSSGAYDLRWTGRVASLDLPDSPDPVWPSVFTGRC